MSIQTELLGVQRLIRSVVASVAGHALSASDLQDVIQETNVSVLTHTFDPTKGTMANWAAKIARNHAISALRKQRRSPIPNTDALESAEDGRSDSDESEAVSIAGLDVSDPNTDDVIRIIAREQRLDKVQQVFNRLCDNDKHFLLISMRSDYSNEKYAAQLGVQPVALRVRKFRLGELIRSMLAKLDS